ncbi:MAG: InlB B-repeat-containing protein [Methanocorpusculum sp.]|nr:InlB B-repeat-containing protein [Methanocorpusculum sp.]
MSKGTAEYEMTDSVTLNGEILSSEDIKVSVGNNNFITTKLYELTTEGRNVSLALILLEKPTNGKLTFQIGEDTTATVTVPALSNEVKPQKAVAKTPTLIHVSYPDTTDLATFTATPLSMVTQSEWKHDVYLPMTEMTANTIFMTKKDLLVDGTTTHSVTYGFTKADKIGESSYGLGYYMPLNANNKASWTYSVATADRYGPIVYHITFDKNPASETIMLIPGANANGVTWTGTNNDELTISKAGTYQVYGSSLKLAKLTYTNPATAANVEVTGFDALKTLLEAGADVKLGEDILNHDFGTSGDNERIFISSGNPTLDLNGHTLSATTSKDERSFIKISVPTGATRAKLTVMGSGTISVTGTSSARPYLFFVGRNGDLLVESGTYQSSAFLISGNGNEDPSYEAPNITINDGALTSGATAIYMPADDGKLTINGGTIISQASGIDVRAGTITLNGGTLTANGDQTIDWDGRKDLPLSDGSAIILASVENSYSGQITVKISGTANIVSQNAAAIRNYVWTGDGKSTNPTVSVTIEGGAKLSGSAATLETNQRTTGTPPVAGTITLSGGYYKAPAYDKLLVDIYPAYADTNHAMSDTPVKDDYYAPVEIKKQTSSATASNEGGTVTITPNNAQAAVDPTDDKKVTITPTGDSAITLTLTYTDTPNVDQNGVVTSTSAPSIVKAEYNPVSVPQSSGAVDTTFILTVATTGDNDLTLMKTDSLPTISTEINEDAKTKLQGTATLISMVTVDITKIKSKNPVLTLTFKVPKSWFAGKDLSAVRAYHFDGTKIVDKGAPTITEDGTDYIFTITATEASPWGLGLKSSSPAPGPGPQPVSSSGDGNMENAFRVLFDTKGGSFISPSTGLSYGDKISQPPAPTKDGYTFGGWYTDSACTQEWSFASGINGDMTLYAKWTAASGSTTTTTAKPTTQTTTKPTSAPVSTQSPGGAATTAVPVATTVAGVSPTLTKAPAPVAGLLFGLLAAGILIRRRD